LGLSVACGATLQAAQYDLSWYTVASGCGASNGASYQLEGTMGQPAAGTLLSGGGYELTGGFWAGVISTVPPPPSCEGDANGDGTVDPLDAGYVSARFGCEVGTGDAGCDAADGNGDGLVDPLDAGFVLARFGPCP